MSKLFALLSLIRIYNLFIAVFAIVITFYLLDEPLSVLTIFCSMIVVSCMCSGYIVNDLLDVENDIINDKENFIAKKIITTKGAYLLNIFFVFFCMFLSFYVKFEARLFLFIIIIPLLYLYNFFFKKYAIIGNCCVALMLAFVFYFTELVITGFVQKTHIIVFFAFGLNFIRELIKDICDIKGDKSTSMYTFPIIFGYNFSIFIVKILILIFSVVLVVHAYYYSIENYLICMIILVEIPLFYSLFLLSRSSSKKTIYHLTKLYKIININGLAVIIFMKEIF